MEDEAVGVTAGLLDDEEGKAPVGLPPVRVGPGEQHQGVGSGGERAPRLHAVHEEAGLGRRGGDGEARHVRAEVRLGDGDGDHERSVGDAGEQAALLFLGAPFHERPGEDLGSGDEGAAGAEGRPRQLLCRHDHAEVVIGAPGGEAA